MTDIIQESYEILNKFLGEINNRNLKRIPEKHEPLLRAIQNLVSYSYELGLITGQDNVNKEVWKLFRQFDQIPRYPNYKSLEEEQTK